MNESYERWVAARVGATMEDLRSGRVVPPSARLKTARPK
jgi:hypothetical protein